ncbi:MAG: hypothetical protein PHV68_07875, partial [Candidatus Gastranaerophilales bacterium]|nr:hypothetical protein [Candidatus Gastranaerophilales bacterium]
MIKIKFAIIFVSCLFLLQSAVFANEKIAVFSVNIPATGSSFSVYPNSLNIIANDVINNMNLGNQLRALDFISTEQTINNKGLKNEYIEFLRKYKTTYAIDYDTCSKLGDELGVDKFLLISGGFDAQNMILKRSWLDKLSFPGVNTMKPSYKFLVTALLIDIKNGVRVWEQTYSD